MSQPLLSVKNLTIDYIGEEKDFRAVDDVSFDVAPGEVFGLAGESGCGKSTIAFAISRLHKPPALIRKGSEILLAGRDVLDLDKQALANFRWREVAMVFQSAMNSLNPVLRIEDQFYDVLKTHKGMTKAQAVGTIYLTTATCGLGALLLHQVNLVGAAVILTLVACVLVLIGILETTGRRNAAVNRDEGDGAK